MNETVKYVDEHNEFEISEVDNHDFLFIKGLGLVRKDSIQIITSMKKGTYKGEPYYQILLIFPNYKYYSEKKFDEKDLGDEIKKIYELISAPNPAITGKLLNG